MKNNFIPKNDFSHLVFIAKCEKTTIEYQKERYFNPQAPIYTPKDIPSSETEKQFFERERWDYCFRNCVKESHIKDLTNLLKLIADE